MSDSRTQKIKALRKVFEDAKNAPRRNNFRLLDRDLNYELGCALIEVGKDHIYELKDEVYPYLKDPFAEFRAEAVKTLGWDTRLFDKDFCEKEAYQIWLTDSDNDVKRVALSAWADYYRDTKDPFVLKNLYDVFVSDRHTPLMRAWALDCFINVAEASDYPQGFCDDSVFDNCYLEDREYLGNDQFLSEQVDWQKVHSIMEKYVPDWRATTKV